MTSNHPPLTLTIPSDLRMLSVTRCFVDAVCQACTLDAHTAHAVILASSEAITNVIRHAHHNRPGAAVQLEFRLYPDLIEILVYDEGAPFDIAAVPDLDPAELRVGGRGVFLMRALMDELSCRPRAGSGNILRMVKRFPTDAPLRECG